MLLIGFFCSLNMTVKGQNSDCYTKYSFQEFLEIKTTDADDYVRTIYKNLVYPYSKETENDIELNTIIKVYLIHNNSESIEIVTTKKILDFDLEIIKVLKKVNTTFLKIDETKYITELDIQIDFEPHDEFDKFNYSKIHIMGFKTKY